MNYVIDTVVATGGIKYAAEKMQCYKNEAIDILNEFDDSEAKTYMIKLVDYITDRTY